MDSKNKEFKQTYIIEKKFEQLFTGQRIELDHSGKLIISPCLNSIKFTDIENGVELYEITTTTNIDADGKSDGEQVVTFGYKQNHLVVAYNSGLLRHYLLEVSQSSLLTPEKQTSDEENCARLAVDSVMLRTWKSMHVGPIASVLFDSTNTLLATGGSDGSLKVWDIVNNYCTHNFKEARGVLSTIAFAPNYTTEQYHIFASGDDYVVHVWNLITSTQVALLQGHNSKVTAIVFAENGQRVITASRDKLVILWNGISFDKERTIAIYESVESVQLVPRTELTVLNNKLIIADFVLVTGGQDGVLKVWDYKNGNLLYTQTDSLLQIKKSRFNHDETNENTESDSGYTLVSQLLYHQSIGQLVAVSFDKDIIFHSISDLSPFRQLVGYNDEILDIKLIGDKQTHIAVATNSPKIKVFELASSNCYFLLGHTDIVLALAVFAQNPHLMVSSSKDNCIIVWHFDAHCASAIPLYRCTGHTHSVTSLATSVCDPASKSDELFFLSGSEDTTLKFWKVPELPVESVEQNSKVNESLISKYTQSCHEKMINSIDISPNNQLVATGSQDRTAKLWLLPNLKLFGVIRGHKKGIWHVKFSPVDQVLATCSADTSIKIWSINDCTCLKTFQGHTSSVLKLSFVDHGMQFITSASDGNLKLWNLKANECVSTFDAHEGKVWALEVFPDEERLVTGSDDSKIALWKNITTEVKEKEAIKAESALQSEQTLQNLLHKKKWLKALRMAIRMEHPLRALNILKEMLLDQHCIEGLVEQLAQLREDQLLTLLEYAVHWNTNSKHFLLANSVLRAIFQIIPSKRLLMMPEFKSKVEQMLPYAERHIARVNRLKQYATFADFVYEQMKLPDSDHV